MIVAFPGYLHFYFSKYGLNVKRIAYYITLIYIYIRYLFSFLFFSLFSFLFSCLSLGARVHECVRGCMRACVHFCVILV